MPYSDYQRVYYSNSDILYYIKYYCILYYIILNIYIYQRVWSNGDLIWIHMDTVAWGYNGHAISDISLGTQSYGRVRGCQCQLPIFATKAKWITKRFRRFLQLLNSLWTMSELFPQHCNAAFICHPFTCYRVGLWKPFTGTPYNWTNQISPQIFPCTKQLNINRYN